MEKWSKLISLAFFTLLVLFIASFSPNFEIDKGVPAIRPSLYNLCPDLNIQQFTGLVTLLDKNTCIDNIISEWEHQNRVLISVQAHNLLENSIPSIKESGNFISAFRDFYWNADLQNLYALPADLPLFLEVVLYEARDSDLITENEITSLDIRASPTFDKSSYEADSTLTPALGVPPLSFFGRIIGFEKEKAVLFVTSSDQRSAIILNYVPNGVTQRKFVVSPGSYRIEVVSQQRARSCVQNLTVRANENRRIDCDW